MQLVSGVRRVLETVPSDFTVGPDASWLVPAVAFAHVILTHGKVSGRVTGLGVMNLGFLGDHKTAKGCNWSHAAISYWR